MALFPPEWDADPVTRRRPRAAKPIDNAAHLQVEDLEKRQLFNVNVFLPQRLAPIEGLGGYAQDDQLFRPATTNLWPDLGLHSVSLTLAGSFTLTDSGGYSLSLNESGPDGSGSFTFSQSGTLSFLLTEQGTFAAGIFSVNSVVLSQTASLSWSFLQTDGAGHTVQYRTGLDTFPVSSLGTAVLDPFFIAGFNWRDPTSQLSGSYSLGLSGLMATSFSLQETNGSDSFTLSESNGSATLGGNGTAALMDSPGQSGQQSYADTAHESFSYTNSGSDTFTLSQAGTYSPGGGFALSSVAYNERGGNSFQFTDLLTLSQSGTATDAGSQSFSGSNHTLGAGSGDSFQFSELQTYSYGENGSGTYALYEGGSYGAGGTGIHAPGFNLSSFSYSAQGSGALSMTQTAAQTQTGTETGSNDLAGTESQGVAGTLTNADTVTDAANFTATSLDTALESVSAGYTLSEQGSYASGSFALSSFNLAESGSGTTTFQHSDTLTEAGTETTTQGGSGSDSFALGLASTHTVTGLGSSGFARTQAGTFSETATDSSTQTAASSYTLAELGSALGGSYSLSSYVFRSGVSGSFSTADTTTDSHTGGGSAAESGSDANGQNDSNAGNVASGLGNDTFQTGDSFSYQSAATSAFSEAGSFSQGTYQAGSFAHGSFAFGSIAFNQAASETWSLSNTDSGSDSGTDSSTDSGTGQDNGFQFTGAGSLGDLTQDTFTDTTTDTFADTYGDTVTETGGDSYSFSELGSYAGSSYALSNVVSQDAGSATDTTLQSAADSVTGTATDSTSTGGNDNSSQLLGIGTRGGLGTSSGTDQSTTRETSAETFAETVTSSDSWNSYEAGSFSNGSWSFSSVAYGESFSDSFSLQQTDGGTDSSTETASSTDTGTDAGTTSYGGGAFNGNETAIRTDSSTESFSDSWGDTVLQAGADSFSLSEQGTFGGFSYAFASLVYSGGDSFAETVTHASQDSFSGTGRDTTTDQGQGSHFGNFGASSQVATDSVTDTGGDSFTTSGSDSFSQTETSTDQSTFYQAGSFAFGSYGLSSVTFAETVTTGFSEQSADTRTDSGTTSATDTRSDGGTFATPGATQPGTDSSNLTGVETVTGTSGDTTTRSENVSSTSSWSLSEQGRYANFSYAFSSWVYQNGETFAETVTDSSSDRFAETVSDGGGGSDGSGSGGSVGYGAGSISDSSVQTVTGSQSESGGDSGGDTWTSSGSESLYEAGSFSFGSYALSSVAYSEGGSDSWASQSSDSFTQSAAETLTVTGTFGTGGTLGGYGGGSVSSHDTITGSATFTVGETTTAGETTSDAGSESWSLSEQGTYSGYSFAFGSVVYREGSSDAGTFQESSGDSFSSSTAISANDTATGSSAGCQALASATGADTATDGAGLTQGASGQGGQSETDTGSSSYSLYEAGSYAGDSFAFSSVSYQAGASDSSTAAESSSSSDSYTISGSDSSSDSSSDGGGLISTTVAGGQSRSEHGGSSFGASDTSADSFSASASESWSLSEQGSYANGSYAFSSYVYATGESATFGSQQTQTDSLGGTDSGGQSDGSDQTTTSSVVDPPPNSGQFGPPSPLTVTRSDASTDSSSYSGTVSAADTHLQSDTSTVRQTTYQAGSFAAGSFSYGSVVFSSSSTDSRTDTDSDSGTTTDGSSDGASHDDTFGGANAADDGSDVGSSTDGSAGTNAASDSTSDTNIQTVTLYEAGSYAGGSYALSSYSLLEQVGETVTLADSNSASSLDTGSTWDDDVQDGYTEYDGGQSFSDSASSAQTVSETMVRGFTLSEQGSFAGGSFALSNYLFGQNESVSESMTESSGDSDSFSGTNQGQSYSGGGGGSGSDQEVMSSSGSVTEQGRWAGGSFALSAVSYQGSGSDSFSRSDSGSDSWSGGYSGVQSHSDSASGNGSYSVGASGSYAGGCFALSSYALTGGSSGSYSDQSSETQDLAGAASSWSNSASGQESDTLYQAGSFSAGAYSNGSYLLSDGSSDQTVSQAQGPGYDTGHTWSNTASTNESGSGTSGSESQSGVGTYSWLEGLTGQTLGNAPAQSSSPALPGSAVIFAAPDATTVPVAAAGADGGAVSGGGAPVAAAPSLTVVQTTANWLGGEGQLAKQAVAAGEAKGAQAPAGAKGLNGGQPGVPGQAGSGNAGQPQAPAGGGSAAATTSPGFGDSLGKLWDDATAPGWSWATDPVGTASAAAGTLWTDVKGLDAAFQNSTFGKLLNKFDTWLYRTANKYVGMPDLWGAYQHWDGGWGLVRLIPFSGWYYDGKETYDSYKAQGLSTDDAVGFATLKTLPFAGSVLAAAEMIGGASVDPGDFGQGLSGWGYAGRTLQIAGDLLAFLPGGKAAGEVAEGAKAATEVGEAAKVVTEAAEGVKLAEEGSKFAQEAKAAANEMKGAAQEVKATAQEGQAVAQDAEAAAKEGAGEVNAAGKDVQNNVNCFPAGTLVSTVEGLRLIDAVKAGERVWGYDLVAGVWRPCRVRQTFCTPHEGLTVFVTAAGETVEATALHPFWVVRGEDLDGRPREEHLPLVPTDATTAGRWVDAGDLRVGDELLLRDGRAVAVEQLAQRFFQGKVYNYDVEGLQCYAVGQLEMLVHNNNGEPIQMHHSDPEFMGGNPHQELTEMTQGEHQDLHQTLNEFLEQQEDGFGNNMRPGPTNSGQDIQSNFTRERLLQAMADFYNTNWDEWPQAADDFFKQWPHLDMR